MAKLAQKHAKKLRKLLQAIEKEHHPKSIDITLMSWPLLDDSELRFLLAVNNADRDWNFEIPREVLSEYPNSKAWSQVTSFISESQTGPGNAINANVYIRVHDDNRAQNLKTGKKILDGKRPELKKPQNRMAFRKPKSLKVNRKHNRERIRRGDSAKTVRETFNLSENPRGKFSIDDSGVTININDRRRVTYVLYAAPFEHKICGVWIGLSAWQVDQILGPAKLEMSKTDWDHKTTVRTWEYNCNGKPLFNL